MRCVSLENDPARCEREQRSRSAKTLDRSLHCLASLTSDQPDGIFWISDQPDGLIIQDSLPAQAVRVILSAGLKFMVSAKRSRSKSIQPSLLLAAANQVVVRQGVDALTLDAVAGEAGVSKGGLLHHFPTKEALIAGMVQQALDKFVETLQQELAKDPAPDTPGHWVRAYIRATALDDQENYELHFNLLAANFTNPELLKPMRDFWQECHTQIMSSGLDPAVATVIRLAMDGLWLTHLHNFAPLQDPLRSQVIETALKLAQP